MVKLVLFDIDGTLVHTGGAGRSAFARTLSAAFNSHAGVHMVSFAGRTDVSLVRELFGVHGIPATPENFRNFFDHYAFCLDHVMQQAGGDACDGARDFILELLALPDAPMIGLLTGNIRLGAEIKLRSHGLWEIFRPAGLPTTTRNAIKSPPPPTRAAAGCSAENCAARKLSWSATRRLTSAAENSSAQKSWPSPPAARRWRN